VVARPECLFARATKDQHPNCHISFFEPKLVTVYFRAARQLHQALDAGSTRPKGILAENRPAAELAPRRALELGGIENLPARMDRGNRQS
jgi:hypothetical protein